MNFLGIDFETANYSRTSACSIGLVLVEDGIITKQAVHLIRPPTSEFVFTHVHGLSWRDVAQAKTFGQLWPEIKEMFEGIDFVAAHNSPFDKGVLSSCLLAASIPCPEVEFVCSLKESKKAWPTLPGYKLSDVCRHLNIPLNHHEALSDALGCVKIILAIKKLNGQIK